MDSGIGTLSATAASRPGAISLLDKYASINSSIEDSRRRTTEVRSNLEQCNLKILTLVEEQNGMETENEQANKDKLRLLAELKEAEKLYQKKMMEKDRVQSDQRLAKLEYDKMRRFIEVFFSIGVCETPPFVESSSRMESDGLEDSTKGGVS